jgi:TonB family protein
MGVKFFIASTVAVLSLAIFAGSCTSAPPMPSAPPVNNEFQSYIQDLNNRVDPFWKQELKIALDQMNPKSGPQKKNLIGGNAQATCSVEIRLDRAGKVKKVKLFKSSGYKVVDAAAIRAIKKASPLPAPPKSWLKGRSAVIRWVFVLKDQ